MVGFFVIVTEICGKGNYLKITTKAGKNMKKKDF